MYGGPAVLTMWVMVGPGPDSRVILPSELDSAGRPEIERALIDFQDPDGEGSEALMCGFEYLINL